MKFCGKCGTENIDEDLFCVKCGSSLSNMNADPNHVDDKVSENNELPKSNKSYLLLGRISCIIAMIFDLAIICFWKFDVEVTGSKTGILIETQQMTLIDMIGIQIGSVLSLVVIIMILLSICSIINPVIGAFNSIILWFGVGISGSDLGVYDTGYLIDLVYKFPDFDPLSQFIVPSILILVINVILSIIPTYLYENKRKCSGMDEFFIFWREPDWYYLKKIN